MKPPQEALPHHQQSMWRTQEARKLQIQFHVFAEITVLSRVETIPRQCFSNYGDVSQKTRGFALCFHPVQPAFIEKGAVQNCLLSHEKHNNSKKTS
jgi:hypothetical protein